MADLKSKTLDMIGNAHLDPVWLWTWQEGFQEAKATFRSALDRMREYDDFLFTSSSAALYEWIERNDPEMFEEIRQRVAEGRWEIAGGWWIQPDCNLPSGESFVRQGLYGQRFFKEKLGVTATVGYNVDSFGHAGSLPQILLKSGLSHYVFMRPHPHEQHLPSRLFWWESDDGSRVLTYRIPYEYCTWGKGLEQHIQRCAAEFNGGPDELMCFYGVGNHGGGPTRENIESIRQLSTDPAYPTLRFSTPSRYFESVCDGGYQPPVFHNELQMHAVGCYAAHSGVKRCNRRAENLLVTAETLSALAMRVVGQPYPDGYDRAWKGVLFNEFHDILAGTSIEPAYDDARNLYGEAIAIASRNLNDAVQAISWRVNIEHEEGIRPFVVFNSHSWQVRQAVEHELARVHDDDVLLDDAGRQVPMQRVRSYATVASGSRNRISFAADLPPWGYRTYRLVRRAKVESFPTVKATDCSLENDLFRVVFDSETGYLTSLYHRAREFEFLRGPARPIVLEDASDTWSHGVVHYDDVKGAFTLTSMRLVEDGPVKSVVRIESAFGSSTLVQDFTMYPGSAQIDIHVTVDWHEQFKLLKLEFPLYLDFPTYTYDIPYGHIDRPATGEERPHYSWMDMTGVGRGNGSRMGLSILNDGKYSADADRHALRLTVLRSPIYAHHDPYVPQAGRDYTFTDQGVQRFTYSLYPHDESWTDAGTARRAVELNRPPVVQIESPHCGPLPQSAGYLSVDAHNVDVTSIKRAEDEDALVLRCFETAGRRTQAKIELPAWTRAIKAEFAPSELKTFLVPADEGEPVREVSLIEW